MLLVRYLYENTEQYGVVEGNLIRPLAVTPFEPAWNVNQPVYEGQTLPLSQVSVLAPCQPSKYVGVGLNYLATIKAMNRAMPKHPILFVKPSTSVVGDGDFVEYPHPCRGEAPGLAFEGELAVVIGKKCKNIEIMDAKKYILGYTITNDVSDLEKMDELSEGNPVRVKCGDTYGPIGPYISTDLDPDHAHITTWLDEDLMQDVNTDGLLFKPYEIVSYVSKFMTLLPGDVLATGTPPGLRVAKPGEMVRIQIDGIGVLHNRYKGYEANTL